MVEGFTARVKVGGLQSPRVSALVVRRRIDRLDMIAVLKTAD